MKRRSARKQAATKAQAVYRGHASRQRTKTVRDLRLPDAAGGGAEAALPHETPEALEASGKVERGDDTALTKQLTQLFELMDTDQIGEVDMRRYKVRACAHMRSCVRASSSQNVDRVARRAHADRPCALLFCLGT